MPSSKRPTLKITNEGNVATGTRVALDDMDISAAVVGVNIEFKVGELVKATIELRPDGLEVSSQAMMMLQAAIQVDEPKEDK